MVFGPLTYPHSQLKAEARRLEVQPRPGGHEHRGTVEGGTKDAGHEGRGLRLGFSYATPGLEAQEA